MKDNLQRQIWILSELYRQPEGVTYKELAKRWENSLQNSMQTPLCKRTFADSLRAIDTTFGIIVEKEDYDVETIRLKVYDTNHRREYMRSLPLHWTQQETEQHGNYSIFEMRLAPTYYKNTLEIFGYMQENV